MAEEYAYSKPENITQPKKSHKKLIIVIVLVSVILISIVFLYLYFNPSNSCPEFKGLELDTTPWKGLNESAFKNCPTITIGGDWDGKLYLSYESTKDWKIESPDNNCDGKGPYLPCKKGQTYGNIKVVYPNYNINENEYYCQAAITIFGKENKTRVLGIIYDGITKQFVRTAC